MAGFIALGNHQYLGELTLNEANGVENGTFAKVNLTAGTASLIASNAEGDADVYFINNEITTIVEQGIDDVNFKLANGKFVRLHYPQKGEILVTTKYTGTPVKGDLLAVGVAGVLEAVAARTPKFKFQVQEVTTAFGTNALRVIVL